MRVSNTSSPTLSIPIVSKNRLSIKRQRDSLRASQSAAYQAQLTAKFISKPPTATTATRSINQGPQKAASSRSAFFDNLAGDLYYQIEQCNTQMEQFECVQVAFSKLIDHFPTYKEGFEKVKNGYDGVINKIIDDLQQHARDTLEVARSQTSINYELNVQQQKFNSKSKKLKDQYHIVEEQVKYIKEEYDNLIKERDEIQSLNDTSSEVSEQNVGYIQRRQQLSDSCTNEYQKKYGILEKLRIEYKNAVDGIEDSRKYLNETLDEILRAKNLINELRNEINHIQEETNTCIQETAATRKEIENQKEIIQRKREELQDSLDEADSIRKSMNELKVNLAFLVGASLNDPLADDPIAMIQYYEKIRKQ